MVQVDFDNKVNTFQTCKFAISKRISPHVLTQCIPCIPKLISNISDPFETRFFISHTESSFYHLNLLFLHGKKKSQLSKSTLILNDIKSDNSLVSLALHVNSEIVGYNFHKLLGMIISSKLFDPVFRNRNIFYIVMPECERIWGSNR